MSVLKAGNALFLNKKIGKNYRLRMGPLKREKPSCMAGCASLNQMTSIFSITPCYGGEQATIPQLKAENRGFHMTPIALIFLVK